MKINCVMLIIGRTSKVTPPPCYKGGGAGGVDKTPPLSFTVFQYFGEILPFLESV